jgi:hypothetical protein
MGAPAIVDTLKLAPSCGTGTEENERCAAENAWCSVSASFPASGGNIRPNRIRLAGLKEPAATCHFAFWRTCEIWIAKKSASGSPSVQRRFTDPCPSDSTFSNSVFWAAEIVRHATTAFSFSVSKRAFAASASSEDVLDCNSVWARPATFQRINDDEREAARQKIQVHHPRSLARGPSYPNTLRLIPKALIGHSSASYLSWRFILLAAFSR